MREIYVYMNKCVLMLNVSICLMKTSNNIIIISSSYVVALSLIDQLKISSLTHIILKLINRL